MKYDSCTCGWGSFVTEEVCFMHTDEICSRWGSGYVHFVCPTCVHIHKYIHTEITVHELHLSSYMHACMHTYIHTEIRIGALHVPLQDTYIWARSHAYIHTHMYVYTHAYTNNCTHVYMHTYTFSFYRSLKPSLRELSLCFPYMEVLHTL
jgi:hypothetical protein